MKLGIIGLPQCGKLTVFCALTGEKSDTEGAGAKSDARLAAVTVQDERLAEISALFQPKKTTYAKIEYMLPSALAGGSHGPPEGGILNQVRTCDALIHVVRNHSTTGDTPDPEKDFWQVEEDMILNDLAVTEKKIEKLDLDIKRGRKEEAPLQPLMESCLQILGNGEPLRNIPDLAGNPALSGFTFLTAKPILVIVNNDDEDETLPDWNNKPDSVERLLVRGRLEKDIASMTQEEAEEFLEAYDIEESALTRVINSSYRLLNRITFFTVNPDEARAWSIRAATSALDAAGTVHSDMKKGFIRAEVLAYEDLKKTGSLQEAKKAGLVRLEGKAYEVKDGDIIYFRFNV